MPKGAPKPVAAHVLVSVSRLCLPAVQLSHTHEGPVFQCKRLLQRVKRDVAARALRVVVGRAHLCAGG